jgi:hypothetical protein
MAARDASIDDLIRDLSHSRSPKRRAAAKQIRRRRDVAAGPALLASLEEEVKDVRTWETQYQMIMALGEAGYGPSRAFLLGLTERGLEPMVELAIGVVRLSSHRGSEILRILSSENRMQIVGAARAVRDAPGRAEPGRDRRPTGSRRERRGRWPAFLGRRGGRRLARSASRAFLEACLRSERSDAREAATASLAGKYVRWRPL